MSGSTSKSKKKCMKTNAIENTMVQKLWDSTEVVLREKYIGIEAHLMKQENLK